MLKEKLEPPDPEVFPETKDRRENPESDHSKDRREYPDRSDLWESKERKEDEDR